MRTIEKRIAAIFIDTCIYAGILVVIFNAFGLVEVVMLNTPLFLLTMLPILFKDCLFRNASLGKKLMGISIYDTNWKKPHLWILVLRVCLIHIRGLVFVITHNYVKFVKLERSVLKTIVIDNNVFENFKKEVEKCNEDFVEGMTKRYNEYLSSHYN